MTTPLTTTETAAYVALRFSREDRAGIEAIAAGIVWGLHNPDDLQKVLDGKTPPAWKALRKEIEDKTTSAKARQWSTNTRKAAIVLLTDHPSVDVTKFGPMGEAVDQVIALLAPRGTNAYAINKAFAKMQAPAADTTQEPVADAGAGAGDVVETPTPDKSAVTQIADMFKDMMDHGLTGNVTQGDIAQIMQFCIAAASDATLHQVSEDIAAEMLERINAAEIANAA